MSSTTKQKSIT